VKHGNFRLNRIKFTSQRPQAAFAYELQTKK